MKFRRIITLESQKINRKKLYQNQLLGGIFTFLLTLSCSLASSASAAEKLTLRLGPLHQSVNVSDLEKFIKTGKLSPSLQPYAAILTPQARQILNKSLHIDPRVANKFLEDLFRSPEGKKLIEQLSKVIPTSSTQQLQTALTVSVRQTKDLNLVNFLRSYPIDNITVDLTSAVGIAIKLNSSYLQSRAIAPLLERDLKTDTDRYNFPALDPTITGKEKVRKRVWIFTDKTRDRSIPVDVYYSQNSHGPLVVMSHGFAANRKFLAYLARHLASHGLTVVSLEHPGSNLKFLNQMSVGINFSELFPASEFIDRPKDISFLLDELEKINQKKGFWKNRFNTKQVSVIGHSFGGYTALALAGAELNLRELRLFCQELSPLGRSPADWLQCAAANLPYGNIRLRDPRIVQAIAFNPIAGNLFGDSLTQIAIPTLILSASEDGITPVIEHQLKPFKQLRGEKYLLAAIGGTHLSVTDITNSNSPMAKSTLVKEIIAEEAEPLRNLVSGVSLAFIYQLTPESSAYKPFLTPAYVQSFSNSSISLRLSTNLPVGMNALLDVFYFSNDQIAWRVTKNKQWLISKLRDYFWEAKRILPQPEYCTGKLEEIFTDLLNDRHQNSGNLS